MNLNLLSYLLFFPAMVAIAVWTAQVCHRNGRVWMLRIFDGGHTSPRRRQSALASCDRAPAAEQAAFVDAVNNALLVGCYAVSSGYVALVLSLWEPIATWSQLLGALSQRIAVILFGLAGLHYTNITVLLVWSRIKHKGSKLLPIRRNTNHEPRAT